jgi:diacylglycerol O-acyltransferase / wax synthase
MASSPPLDRLTASDLFLLWDDYGWSSDIGGVAIVDGAALLDESGRIRIEEVRRRLEPRLDLVPRFRQLLYSPRLGLGWPLWVDAPSFDIADHVRVQPLPETAGESDLLEACARLGQRPLDRARPLWELWLLPGLPEKRVGAYLKLHHAIADGTAAMAAFAALLDLDDDVPVAGASSWTPAPIPTTRALLADNLRRRGRELGRSLSGAAHPVRTVRRMGQVLPAWREVLLDKPAPHTSVNSPVGSERRLAIVRSRLDLFKAVAHAHGAKVNDVVLTAVAGGLSALLAGRGELVEGLEQRAMVTLSEHKEESGGPAGNKPGWMMVPLPLTERDPVRLLERIARETAARKQRARPEAGTGIFRFVFGQRVWYRMFPKQQAVNVVVSNVPGPPMPLYLTGARVLEAFPMMPTMGNLNLVVAGLSYAGQLNITVIVDRNHCPDVAVFVRGVRETVDALANSVLEAAS